MKQTFIDIPICYFPGTHEPVPQLLTVKEVTRFLRLDRIAIKHPERTVERYRRLGRLRAVQVGKQIVYRLPDVLAFIDKQIEVNPR